VVADLPASCGARREADALVVVASTFATPFVQRPTSPSAWPGTPG